MAGRSTARSSSCGRGASHSTSCCSASTPPNRGVRKLAGEWPATLIIFDILARDGRDLRGASTDARRAELEALAVELGIGPAPDRLSDLPAGPSWLLTPRTTDPEEARRWYADEVGIGQDGLIARRGEDPYREGKRAMLKIKHRRTVDCVVAGYRVAKSGDGVGSLLLGLFDGGELQYVGHTSSFRAAERRKLLEDLQPYAGDGGFGEGRTPGGPSRWTGGRDTAWVPLRPELVCEVSFDRMQGVRFRHAATFIRWRPERDPGSCTFDQLSSRR